MGGFFKRLLELNPQSPLRGHANLFQKAGDSLCRFAALEYCCHHKIGPSHHVTAGEYTGICHIGLLRWVEAH